MEVRVLQGTTAQVVPNASLPEALADPDAIVWVDMPDLDDEALGMNVIVNTRTQGVPLVIALTVMVTMSAYLLRWARHNGWW